MRKICFVTATRAEYGLLRWVMHDLSIHENIQLQIIATGTHLSPEYGLTYKIIEADGFKIDYKLEYLLSTQTACGIAKSMGVCGISIPDMLSALNPDILVVLGDRYELLPICSAALVLRIPIAHISGGDITEGAIDNQIRNAVTMLSSLHFPGTAASRDNIIRMIGSDQNVFTVGETGLDNFTRNTLMNREELAASLNLNSCRNWIMATLHPETKQDVDYNVNMTTAMLEAITNIENTDVIMTQSNADLGGHEINKLLKDASEKHENFHFFTTLGSSKYISILKELWFMIGNSSSGIVEAPYVGIPVINIGNRQKGRHLCKNVIQVKSNEEDIKTGICKAVAMPLSPDFYYGDGGSSSRITKHIIDFLEKQDIE